MQIVTFSWPRSCKLADTNNKRRGHHDDLTAALKRGRILRLADLFALTECPAGEAHTFCGESASLVEFLVRQQTRGQFLRFVRLAAASGYDQALQEVYGIAGTAELERRWGADQAAAGAKTQLALVVDGVLFARPRCWVYNHGSWSEVNPYAKPIPRDGPISRSPLA